MCTLKDADPELKHSNSPQDEVQINKSLRTSRCGVPVVSAAFWDATRAFMLLAVLSCFAGVVLGLSAFTNGTKNKRVRTGGIALLLSGSTTVLKALAPAWVKSHLLFLDCMNLLKPISSSLLLFCRTMTPALRRSGSVGVGHLHRGDGHLLWEALPGLALLLVLHHRLGGHHSGLHRRYRLVVLLLFFPPEWPLGLSVQNESQLVQTNNQINSLYMTVYNLPFRCVPAVCLPADHCPTCACQ